MKLIRSITNKIINERFFPLILLFFCIAAYGLLIPALGFYWDDWPMMWFAKTQGPLGFPGAFSGDRPFLAGIYVITTAILDVVPYQWQILSVLSRWLVVLSAWWALSKLWPSKKEPLAWIAILLAIYPGFKQQPISVVYGNGLVLLAFYYLSYGFMVLAIRNPEKRIRYTLLGLSTYAICLLSTEYYIGLDMIRGVFIWLLLGDPLKINLQKIKKTFFHWLPYLILLFFFMIWRVFIFEFPTYQPELIDEMTQTSNGVFGNLIYRIFHDSFSSGWLAWIETFKFPNINDFSTDSMVLFWVIVVLSAFASFIYLYFFKPNSKSEVVSDQNKDSTWAKEITITGILALLCAGWPYWITDLPIKLYYPYDRFNLAFMLGSCLLIVGLVEWFIKTRNQKIIILSLFISMALGSHLINNNTYRREWMVHNDFFWQLSWRVPELEPGTLLLTHRMPMNYYSDNSLTGPINLVYAADNNSLKLDHYLAFKEVRVGRSIPSLEPDQIIEQGFRNATFTGNTSEILTFFYSPPGCLRIVDPERDKDLPVLPVEYSDMTTISNLDLIITNPEQPVSLDTKIFGQEPAHNWCYYFQKADLAKQDKNWELVAQLGDEAFNLGYYPGENSELLLFIEGYGLTGDIDKSLELSTKLYFENPLIRSSLCSTLDRIESNTELTDSELESVNSVRTKIECQ